MISKSATRPENILLVYVPIVAVRTFGIARSVSRYAERLTGHHIILKIVSDMRVRLYNMLEPASLMLSSRFGRATCSAFWLRILSICRMRFKTIFPAVSALLLYAASVIGLGFSWPFAAFAAIYLFILVVLFPVVSLLEAERPEQPADDAVLGVSDWIGRQAEKAWFDLESKRQRFTRWRDLAAQCLVGGFILIMLFWTAGQYADGSIANTMIAAFVLVVFPLTEAFLPLSDALTEVPSYQDSIKRMSKAAPELRSHEVKQTDEKLDVSDVTLTFDNVTFSYDQHSHVLDRFSFTLRQGKMALLGRSGSGKSTLSL